MCLLQRRISRGRFWGAGNDVSIKPVHEGKASRGLGSVSVLGRSLVLLTALGSEQRAGGVLESTSGTAFGLGQKYFPGPLRMPFKNRWPRTVLRSSHVAPRCEECDLTDASAFSRRPGPERAAGGQL